jgi:hypothetical protein
MNEPSCLEANNRDHGYSPTLYGNEREGDRAQASERETHTHTQRERERDLHLFQPPRADVTTAPT